MQSKKRKNMQSKKRKNMQSKKRKNMQSKKREGSKGNRRFPLLVYNINESCQKFSFDCSLFLAESKHFV
jgi:hypothetical protein